MTGTPSISVVMGVYNGASHLCETIASVLAQTNPDFEFIIVNDGSYPQVAEILSRYALRDERIKVITKSHEGLTKALIAGCTAARGKYIARIDAGDVMTPDRLQRQQTVLDAHPDVVLVTCRTEFCGPEWEHLYTGKEEAPGIVDETCWIVGAIPEQQGEDLVTGPTHHGSTMFRASAYRAAGGYRPQFYYGQDWDLWYRLAECGKFAGLSALLYRCRIFPDGISMRNVRRQASIHECSFGAFLARRNGKPEDDFLLRADAIRPRPGDPSRKRHASRTGAAGCYFIGETLRRNGDGRCLRYLLKALALQPAMLKTWLRIAQYAISRCLCKHR